LIVVFALSLVLKVPVEWVVNDRHVAILTAMRCDQAQEFYFSKPLPSEAVGELMTTNPLQCAPIYNQCGRRDHRSPAGWR
jgi:EAL domain-containing protein (putative c-di-GMP-specific phosphodiesterase class I)